MNDEQKTKKEIKKEIKKPAKKHFLLFILFSLFIVLLFALSMNFTFTYQFKENIKEPTAAHESEKETTTQEEVIAQEKSTSLDHKEKTSHASVKTKLKKDKSCGDLLNLMRDYYNMRLKIEQGRDFTNELEAITRYEISSDSINKNLEVLSGLIKFNMDEDYFRTKFHTVIKDIYIAKQEHKYDFIRFLKNMLFIRPIGVRAIDNGGIDMEISLVEKALSIGNLPDAYEHLINISNDNSKALESFKVELENKLRIKYNLNHLDEINKVDCDEVSDKL